MIIACFAYLMAAHLEMWARWWEGVGEKFSPRAKGVLIHSRLASGREDQTLAAETLTADHADMMLRERTRA